MISLNKRAMKVVRKIVDEAEDIGCLVIKMDCGATVIDMGQECRGSWEAGLLFTRADIGDLGLVQYGAFKLDEHYSFASIEMFIDQPLIACMASQIAGWKLGKGAFATIGSGPARATAHHPTDWYFEMTDYKDDWHEAVICLQDVKYPSEETALEIAKCCRVKPQDLYILTSPSTCLVASVQVSARILEQSCHKMFEKHFHAGQVVHARGSAPIAPFCKDETKTMGRINDALIYGSEVELWVDAEDEDIQKVIWQLVGVTSSPCYGADFERIFIDADKDFFRIDHDVHSLGKVQIHNLRTGKAFRAGEINYEVLRRSFLN
ncbi:MAG: methenyltetrahydromethanopterin cyclohydrolase [Christensenellaceae bacterium]|jgi:methenyltetrahydromethanopterin cyclohydrolase|nr:methenyltetrahydromethanopterin cyclohydrolase [Christensenellaceae bacterium]